MKKLTSKTWVLTWQPNEFYRDFVQEVLLVGYRLDILVILFRCQQQLSQEKPLATANTHSPHEATTSPLSLSTGPLPTLR